MCRWIAYNGAAIPLEDLISKPSNSLLAQSVHAQEAKVETNGDGFGIGWYGERDDPGIYREETDGLIIVSEPLDDSAAHEWLPAPPGHAIIGNRHGVTEIKPMRLTEREP